MLETDDIRSPPLKKVSRKMTSKNRKESRKNLHHLTTNRSDPRHKRKKFRSATGHHHHHLHNIRSQSIKSTYLQIASAIFFSLTLLFIKILNHGLKIIQHHSSTTSFFCGFYMNIFSIMFIKLDGIDITIKGKCNMDIDYLLIRCFSGFLSTYFTIITLNHMRLVSAFTIIYLSPVLTTYFIIKQKMENIKQVDKVCHILSLVIILAFCIQDFTDENDLDPRSFDDSLIGIVCSLIVAGMNSVNNILDRKILYEFHSYTILLVTGLFSVIISPILISWSKEEFNVNTTNFALFFLLGSCCFFGSYFTHKSLEVCSWLNNSSSNYLTVSLIYLYSFIVLDEPLTVTDVLASCFAVIVNYYTKLRMEDCENEDN